ncbi:MAG: heme exporter protein CcmD [Oceanococcus sp.]
MAEWLAMGGYAKYVWPSYAVFMLALVGSWAWAGLRGRSIRKKIHQQQTERAQ